MSLRSRSLLVILAAAALALPAPAAAQIGFGAHYARLADAFGGSGGAGARITVGVPLFPISAAVNGEYFFPGCPDRDCVLRGATADLNLSLPFPGVEPWVGVGWSVRQIDLDNGAGSRTERGLNFGAGARTRLPPFRPYLELRYEMATAPEEQLLLRVGVMLW